MGQTKRRVPAQSAEPQKKRRTRKRRPRQTPRWLKMSGTLDEIGQRRCILILSVLSGERPVTDAIENAGITRALYYQLERKALLAMLRALTPGAETSSEVDQSARIKDLEGKIVKLEQEKRRTERLLFLTRKIVGSGPHKASPGRPRTKAPSSTTTGRKTSRGSTKPGNQKSSAAEISTPTRTGEVGS